MLTVFVILSGFAALATLLALACRRLAATRRALAAAELRQSSIVRSLPEAAVLLFDHDLRFVSAQGAALERLGASPEKIVGRTLAEVIEPTRVERGELAYRRALAGEVTRSETITPGGRIFSVEVAPLCGPDGMVTGGLVVARDMTEQRRAEELGKDAETRFEQAFEQAPIGMAMLSLTGDWLRVNRELADMLGYSAGEMTGLSFAEMTHKDDRDADAELIARCMAGDAPGYQIEKRAITASGDEIVALLSVTLVRDSAERPLYFLAQIMDVTERRRVADRLEYLAGHDPLTGLLNRRRFYSELERQLATTGRYGNDASVIMLDLDRLKVVNDTLGHAAGDEVIRKVASAMRERLRTTDVLARLGGDEFAALLPETGAADAERVARDLIAVIAEHGLISHGDRSVRVTASAGVAAVRADRVQTPDELLIEADVAMYEAKDAGRARVAVREPANVAQPTL